MEVSNTKTLRAVIRESIAAAAVHSKRHWDEEQRAKAQTQPKSQAPERHVPSMDAQDKREVTYAIKSAVSIAGPQAASQVFDHLKTMDLAKLQGLDKGYQPRQWAVTGKNRPKNIRLQAQGALARALVWAYRVHPEDPTGFIQNYLDNAVSGIGDDVDFKKRKIQRKRRSN